jgi:hypothetical protein
MCAAAYLWIPAPSSGKALIQLHEQRALYNSSALAIGTSTIFTLLMGLFGYYLVSNSIKKDIQTRTGFILASTTMKNSEYLIGKFLGNVVFLIALTVGFLFSSMIMQLIRGEAPLEPHIFLLYYGAMIPPLIIFVSTVAVVFESSRFLSGKFGDVLYFAVWLTVIAVAAVGSEKKQYPHAGSYIDSMGMAYLLAETRTISGVQGLAIGSTAYDKTKPPFVIQGFVFKKEWIIPRLSSLLYPIPLLIIPLARFHRFNPDRIKAKSKRMGFGIPAKLNSILKPVSKMITSTFLKMTIRNKASFVQSVLSEVVLALQLYPIAAVLILFFTIFFALASPSTIQSRVPLAFAAMVLVLSDLSTREKTSGTLPVIFSSPKLRANFVLWKISSAVLLALSFTWVAILKLLFVQPLSALALIGGTVFAAAAATALGIFTSNPKTFIVTFLFFLYLVMNDGGHNPGFDFAGWFNRATVSVIGVYAFTSALFIASAQTFYKFQLKRNY